MSIEQQSHETLGSARWTRMHAKCPNGPEAVWKSVAVLWCAVLASFICDPALVLAQCWDNQFSAPGLPGASNIQALAVYDDGTRPALFASGGFTLAGGASANRIAKWDGMAWSPLGSGLNQPALALKVHDDGSGAALFAGGSFTLAGGLTVDRVAKWNGVSWSALGSGVQGTVNALAVFDDGTGPALYVGGSFVSAGGVTVNNVAKWDGSSWAALGTGVAGGGIGVNALAVYNDGTGNALYVAGNFTSAGGVSASNIAKWDGAGWTSLGSGINNTVYALQVFNDGSGDKLYAGGTFGNAGGGAAESRIAAWDGTSWAALGAGVNSTVRVLGVFDDGGGSALFVGGSFTSAGGTPASGVARWRGGIWSAMGSGTDGFGTAYSFAEFDDGDGVQLFVGGGFTSMGGSVNHHVASWNGSAWSSVPQVANGISNSVRALHVFDDGTGATLYAGGGFRSAGSIDADRIAKFDGTAWSTLGSGVNHNVLAMTTFNDGSGNALYAGGDFTVAGGITVNRIAKWDGTSWSSLGGTSHRVWALTVFDDGSGPALYAGGQFTTIGGVSANRIAKWNGSNWSALGDGLNNQVNALAVFDDGTGAALYAGGWFTASGSLPLGPVVKWNGSTWSNVDPNDNLGSGIPVNALAVHDDGTGPALYAGGQRFYADADGNAHLASWNGSAWTPYRPDVALSYDSAVTAFAVVGEGALYASHNATTTSAGLLRKSGSAWQVLPQRLNGEIWALEALDTGSTSDLFIGGSFTQAADEAASYMARLECADCNQHAELVVPDINGDSTIDLRDVALLQLEFGCSEGNCLTMDLDGNGRIELQDWSFLADGVTGPACKALTEVDLLYGNLSNECLGLYGLARSLGYVALDFARLCNDGGDVRGTTIIILNQLCAADSVALVCNAELQQNFLVHAESDDSVTLFDSSGGIRVLADGSIELVDLPRAALARTEISDCSRPQYWLCLAACHAKAPVACVPGLPACKPPPTKKLGWIICALSAVGCVKEFIDPRDCQCEPFNTDGDECDSPTKCARKGKCASGECYEDRSTPQNEGEDCTNQYVSELPSCIYEQAVITSASCVYGTCRAGIPHRCDRGCEGCYDGACQPRLGYVRCRCPDEHQSIIEMCNDVPYHGPEHFCSQLVSDAVDVGTTASGGDRRH